MLRLEDLKTGLALVGLESSEIATIAAVVSIGDDSVQVFYRTPDGQTKERLSSAEAQKLVETSVGDHFDHWLSAAPDTAKTILDHVIERAEQRLKRRHDKKMKRQSVTKRLRLPGKLIDCTSDTAEGTEIFLVEGDSAGGSAKSGRDRKTQAVLPIRGKLLNTESAPLAAVLKNQELNNIVQALGTGIGADFDISRLRYDKVILLMDADVDGHHIATLLLTFFYRHLHGLIQAGHVYIAQPPLYRIDAGKESPWAADDDEKKRILDPLPARYKAENPRFQGLGEMMPKPLFRNPLDPRRRRLLRVEIPPDQALLTDQGISDLMGKDPAARFRFIMDRAQEVEELDV